MLGSTRGQRRIVFGRSGAALSAAVFVLAATLSGCDAGQVTDVQPSDVIRSLGAVPIPSAPSDEPTPTGAVGRPAVLAIGAPARVTLPDGRVGVVTALGPAQIGPSAPATAGPLASGPPAQSTRAVISIELAVPSTAVMLAPGDLSSRDQTGRAIPLASAPAAPVTAQPGHPVSLRLTGTFDSGAAQITWHPGGHALAIWTFNIELD